MIRALVYLGAAAVFFGLGWFGHAEFGKAPASKPAAIAASSPVNPTAHPQPITPPQPIISPSEVQQLRAAHDATLRNDPELAAEYKQIIADMDAQQARFDAAMIKADPKVAPIVAKLVILRQHSMPHPSAVVSTSK